MKLVLLLLSTLAFGLDYKIEPVAPEPGYIGPKKVKLTFMKEMKDEDGKIVKVIDTDKARYTTVPMLQEQLGEMIKQRDEKIRMISSQEELIAEVLKQ